MPGHAYDQAMAANLDLLGRNRGEWRQDAQRHFQLRSLFAGHRPEASIFRGSSPRSLEHASIKRSHWKHVPHASSQLAAQVDCRKHATWFGQVSRRGLKRNFSASERRFNCFVRQPQKERALFRGKLWSFEALRLCGRCGRGRRVMRWGRHFASADSGQKRAAGSAPPDGQSSTRRPRSSRWRRSTTSRP